MSTGSLHSQVSQEFGPAGSAGDVLHQAAPVVKRMNHAFGPIAAGMTLDLMDLITFGPVGFVLGAPFGALAGYWMGTALRLDRMGIIFCTIAGGVYCTIPFTELLPLGTLVGAIVRYQNPELFDEPQNDLTESGHADVQSLEEVL